MCNEIEFQAVSGADVEWLWTGCSLYHKVDGEWVFVPRDEWPSADED